MIPKVESAIQTLSQRVLAHVLPTISSSYVMSDTAMLAMLLNALAQEAENGVANRMADIAAMRALFEQASSAGVSTPPINAMPQSLTLTHVNECHDAMTRRLIDLHIQVEDRRSNEPALEALNQSIWAYLEGDQSAPRIGNLMR